MGHIILVAGGTAGHINAALSLGEYYTKKDIAVEYITGTRYLDKKLFDQFDATYLDSRPLRTKNPFILFQNICKNILIFFGLLVKYLSKRPLFVIGAGGYVCGPTLLAAWLLRIPVYIIEQNACVGLTNKILANISKKIFTHFKQTKGLEKFKNKIVISGNPTRSNIQKLEKKINNEKINILIFGGSLGAVQINDAVEELLKFLLPSNMSILHQVGKDNLKTLSSNISYEQVEYIEDMQKAYQWADVVISRAGASTISELRVVQLPCILIPYPAATDNHQYFNAMQLKEEQSFFVEVVDFKLQGKDLAEKLMTAVNTIASGIHSMENHKVNMPATEIIYKEISKDVWNK